MHTQETMIDQSSIPIPGSDCIRAHSRILKNRRVTTKKTIEGSCIRMALLSPGRFPSTEYMTARLYSDCMFVSAS